MAEELRGARIRGMGAYTPDQVLTNQDLEEIVDTDEEWITTRTGIEERRIASDDQTASDLAYQAAKKALGEAELKPEELDLILVATSTPDHPGFPATACLVQDKLGIEDIPAFDLAAACTGFIYGLSTATQYIRTGVYDHILVIGSEVFSKILDWTDRSTCVLFGDGAGAAVLSPAEAGGVLSNVLGADGSRSDVLKIPGGGSKEPLSQQVLKNNRHYVRMEGKPVFKFAVKILGKAALQALQQIDLNKEDIDYLVPHQANTRIIDAAAKRLDLDRSQIHVNLDKYGNTSAASIPLALREAVKENKITPGDIVVLVGFGAGLTWGATVIEWN